PARPRPLPPFGDFGSFPMSLSWREAAVGASGLFAVLAALLRDDGFELAGERSAQFLDAALWRRLRLGLVFPQHPQIAQRARQIHQHAHVALAFDRHLLALRQPRLNLAHLTLGGAKEPIGERNAVGLKCAMALLQHLPPPRNRRQRLALIGERIAVETLI